MKRILLALASVTMMFASCTPEENLGPAALKVQPATLEFELEGGSQTLDLKATRDWTVTVDGKNIEGITVDPMSGKGSNDPITVTVTATKNEGSNRTVKLVFAAGTDMEETVTLTQPGVKGNEMSIGEALASAANTEVTVKGIVAAANVNSFVMTDGTDNLVVYFGSEATSNGGVKVGDDVKVAGKVGAYDKMAQILEPVVTVVSSGNEVNRGELLEITAENIETMDITKTTHIKMTGIYKKSSNSDGSKVYHNLEIDGTSITGSIALPDGDIATALTAAEGHSVALSGYFGGGAGTDKNNMYRNIILYAVEDLGEPQISYEKVTLAAFYEKEDETKVEVSGTVAAVNTKGFVVVDADNNAVYVHQNAQPTVKIGNGVTVKGKKIDYYKFKQIEPDNVAVTSEATTAPAYPTPKDANTLLDTWVGEKSEYVTVSGVLKGGRYINVDGQTYQGMLSYTAEDYSALNDLNVKVTGYSMSVNTSSKNLAIILVSLEADPYLAVKDANAAANDTEAVIEVKTNMGEWSFTKTEGDWATAVKDGETIKVTFTANETTDARTAKFTVTVGEKSANIVLTQAGALSADATTIEFDFTKEITGWPKGSTNAVKTATTYKYTLDGKEYDFIFDSPEGVYMNDGYLFVKSATGKPGHLGLPIVADKALVKVVATPTGSCSTTVAVHISDSKKESVASSLVWSTRPAEQEYALAGKVGEQYYLTVTAKNCQIAKLKLIYQ